MKQSTYLQRFAAFIIDFIIMLALFEIFAHILGNVIKLPQMTQELANTLPSDLLKIYNQNPETFVINVYSSTELMKEFQEWALSNGKDFVNSYYIAVYQLTGFSLLFIIIEVFLYYIVLPFVWSKQTVGRFFTKTRVVSLDKEKTSFGQLTLRELVGGYLFYLLNVCCGVTFFVNFILVLTRNATVGDLISKTTLVRLDEPGIENPLENNNSTDNDEYDELARRYGTQNSHVDEEIVIDVKDETDEN